MLDDIVKESLTFDDLLLVPAASNILPRDVNTATLLTKNIQSQHSDRVRRDGYGNGIAHRHLHGPGGRHRHHPPEHEHRTPGH